MTRSKWHQPVEQTLMADPEGVGFYAPLPLFKVVFPSYNVDAPVNVRRPLSQLWPLVSLSPLKHRDPRLHKPAKKIPSVAVSCACSQSARLCCLDCRNSPKEMKSELRNGARDA